MLTSYNNKTGALKPFNGIKDIGPSKAIDFKEFDLHKTNSWRCSATSNFPGNTTVTTVAKKGESGDVLRSIKEEVKAIVGDLPLCNITQNNGVIRDTWCFVLFARFLLDGAQGRPACVNTCFFHFARETQYVEMLQNRYA